MHNESNKMLSRVHVVAQQLKNPTCIHEEVNSIPRLAQWVKYLALLQAVVDVADVAWILYCCGCVVGQQLQLQLTPSLELPYAAGVTLTRKKMLSTFFFFFFFGLLRAAPAAYGGFQARGSNQSYSRWPMPQPQQCQIRATFATYTTTHGNAGSLTH